MATTDTHEDCYELPVTEALLAGTLALMTAHAQACPARRCQVTGRIAENLALLAEQRNLSDPFRDAVAKLRVHWQLIVEAQAQAGGLLCMWHAMPATMQ